MPNESTIPTPATPDVCTNAILIDGVQIPGAYHVVSLTTYRELNRLPAATLVLLDGEAATSSFELSNTDNFIPGKEIEIQLGYRSQNDSVFKGIIIKQSLKIRQNGCYLTVECRDKAVKMTAGQKNKYFIDKKDSDIIEEIISSYGFDKEIEATAPELKEVVQYEVTDWDFMLCRAEANGQVVMVEDSKIIVAKPVTDSEALLNVRFGTTLLELDAEMDSRIQSPGVKAQSWNATDQEVVEAEAAEPSDTGNGNISATDLADVLGGDPYQLFHGGKITQPELQAWADGQLMKRRLAKVRGRAKFQGFAGLKPGNTIQVDGIGERFEGKLYVSGVRHTVMNGNWETDVQLGIDPIPFSEKFNLRPIPAAGMLRAISGLQIGIVTQLESDPDGEDRIKVRIPLISTSEDGIWARISTLDAGNQRGTYFRPEINDEVVVGFLHDDPRYPVVLGMCHSSNKPAPEPPSDDNHHKGYVSREKMKFIFDDEKKEITFETPGGNILKISDDAKGIKLEDQNGNKITLDDSGITLDSSKDLILKAAAELKIGGMNTSIKADGSFKAEGSGSTEISGASTTLKGSGTVTIQGGMVQIN